jgi:hypothetical protein
MCSAIRPCLGVLVVATACGNYSNEDVLFTEAVPLAESLQVALPQNGSPNTCPHPSDLRGYALATGAYLNLSVADLLIDLDLVRSTSPSERRQNPEARVWGPWPDQNHPGFQAELTMTLLDASVPTFGFLIDERRDGDSSWSDLIDGQFVGALASEGSGNYTVHFAAIWALGINKATDPHSDMVVSYDLGARPRSITLDLSDAGLTDPLPPFLYEYQDAADGGASLSFAWFDADAGAEIHAIADFQSDGSGGGAYTLGDGGIDECWEATACMNYFTYTGGLRYCGTDLAPCMGMATPSNCPASIQ